MRFLAAASLVALLSACGGSDPESSVPTDAAGDAASDGSADGSTPDSSTSDTSPSDALTDTGTTDTAPDTGIACTPKAGTAAVKAYCDLFELAYFEMDGAAPRVELRGRVSLATPEPACAVVDTVEVQTGGKTVATLGGTMPFGPGNERAVLASGGGFEALSTRCKGDVDRFSGFGFLIKGRMDGGTFTASCADAEGGSRWPPAVRVTCHKNVDASPFTASATVASGSFKSATIYLTAPHGPGGALKTVGGTIHVIPGAATSFGGPPAPAPFDSTGWGGTLSEATSPFVNTSISLLNTTTTLPAELCPKPGSPGPGYVPPPVFLARLTGTGEHGAYSTEAYVNHCTPSP
ncbi:MAG: hypothetical protein IPJ34_06040 [Myxococcales bacterium]|nr:hypothetical protein [Myxococcales bacterium]